MHRLLLCLFLFFALNGVKAQYAKIEGQVLDSATQQPLEGAYLFLSNTKPTISTNASGRFSMSVPANQSLILYATYTSRKSISTIQPLKPNETYKIIIYLSTTYESNEMVITAKISRDIPDVITINPKKAKAIPNPSGNIESLLKTLGVASGNNELSSGFNVRGGNYDENLIYVNDVEIYRPQLIRSGQQEGLSFINADLVDNIRFSAGGFQARYGDKMSSVLDIDYRKPLSFEAGAQASFLGASAYVGGKKGSRFSYLLGARFRSNAYLLGTFDVQGNYKPIFGDFQSLIRYDISLKTELSLLSGFALNRFLFIPQSQQTSFGTVTQALQLSVFFNGGELMGYQTLTNAATLKHQVNSNFQTKLIASQFLSNEREFYTVEGAYRLDELDRDLGSETFGQARFNRGAGYFINHARNELLVQAYQLANRNVIINKYGDLRFGAELRKELINDFLNEWVYNDSAEFSVPFNANDSLFLFSTIRSRNNLNSNRLSTYIQQSWKLADSFNMQLNTGIRYHYWSLNYQHLVSPRIQFSFEPNKRFNQRLADDADSLSKKDFVVKAAWGVYYQPPFYRELRDFGGNLNLNLKAQRAIHYLIGTDFYFNMWNREFKFSGEAWYKQLDNLVPYLYDNVRIRYYANNNANGYATGIDTRINGEFVKGLESWFSLSLLQTRERIKYLNDAGEQITSPWLRRPTDQRVNLGVFFQDELKNNPDFKVHLNLVFGSGLPYFLTGNFRYNDDFKIPSYRRVDIGFSYSIISDQKRPKKQKLDKFKDMMLSLEVFNLLGVENVASYLWVRDVTGQTFAVPNYLTTRRINLNLMIQF